MAKAQAQEPSMEEILASIRRIIADEDTGPAAASKIAAVAAQAVNEPVVSEDDLDKLFESDDDDDDVLDLAESDKEADVVEALASEPDDADLDLAFEPAKKPEKPAPEPVMARAEPAKPTASVDRRRAASEQMPIFDDPAPNPLLSQETGSMVAAAFDNLSMTILNKNARTVEDLIEDMLRPMLRSWLDQNLPGMVERLVRTEIERIARTR